MFVRKKFIELRAVSGGGGGRLGLTIFKEVGDLTGLHTADALERAQFPPGVQKSAAVDHTDSSRKPQGHSVKPSYEISWGMDLKTTRRREKVRLSAGWSRSGCLRN